MSWTEQAKLLLHKADQDAVIAARAVDDPDISDEITGFHVQQSAEKAIKAVLSNRGIAYRRTHDLQELVDLMKDNAVPHPPEVTEIVEWSPFAVLYRYEEVDVTVDVDRARGVALVRAVLSWARAEIDHSAGSGA